MSSKLVAGSVSPGRYVGIGCGEMVEMSGRVSAESLGAFPASAGAFTITRPPHFGQARICPIADSSRTLSRVLQVVQVMEKGSTVVCDRRSKEVED